VATWGRPCARPAVVGRPPMLAAQNSRRGQGRLYRALPYPRRGVNRSDGVLALTPEVSSAAGE
jgi:hypothetical protein